MLNTSNTPAQLLNQPKRKALRVVPSRQRKNILGHQDPQKESSPVETWINNTNGGINRARPSSRKKVLRGNKPRRVESVVRAMGTSFLLQVSEDDGNLKEFLS
jgi:hypothetical protein